MKSFLADLVFPFAIQISFIGLVIGAFLLLFPQDKSSQSEPPSQTVANYPGDNYHVRGGWLTVTTVTVEDRKYDVFLHNGLHVELVETTAEIE